MTAALNKGELFASFDVDAFEIPHGRDELWRFTPLKRLKGLHTDELMGPAPAVTVSGSDRVRVETVGRDDVRVGSAGIPEDRLSASAWAAFQEATVVTVPAEAEIDGTVMIEIEGTSPDPAASHLVVVAEQFSKARIVLRHHG